jgi:hypothetical protein
VAAIVTAVIQDRIGLSAITGGVAIFGDGPGAHACAVLEVTGAARSLAAGDEGQQEAQLAACRQLLNALTFPIQLLARAEPIDLSGYLGRLEARARQLPGPLASLARDHAAFVRGLTRQRTLLERHLYVVVPADAAEAPIGSVWAGLLRRLLRRKASGASAAMATPEAAARQLTFRCETIAHQLSRAGLRAHRLEDTELARVFHLGWSPELARTQRLRRDLVESTTLVIAAERRSA